MRLLHYIRSRVELILIDIIMVLHVVINIVLQASRYSQSHDHSRGDEKECLGYSVISCMYLYMVTNCINCFLIFFKAFLLNICALSTKSALVMCLVCLFTSTVSGINHFLSREDSLTDKFK